MKRYAFIDAQNTASTTQRMCGFVIDWAKLCALLKDKKRWNCDRIYLYSGIEIGDTTTAEGFAALDHDHGCVVRTKTIMAYKNPDKTIPYKCPNCNTDGVKVIDMGYRKKSNCDVELTIDAMELMNRNTDLMIFTADGDFECLMRKALNKGATVKIVSHPKRYVNKAGQIQTRFSKRLRELVADHPESVAIIDIARWKELIKKDIDAL
ncbi:MAG: NYN domain-containing protein [Patescibacteria group bacterium]